jgi:hypothetical protein
MPDPARHPAIEAFLSEIDARLRRLPEDRRAAEREELAQHLDLLVTAGRIRGMDEDAAVRAAVDRLGRAGPIGAALERAARRNHPKPMDYARMFALCAVVFAATTASVEYAFHRIAGDPLRAPWRVAMSSLLMSALLVYMNTRSRRVQTQRNEGIDA